MIFALVGLNTALTLLAFFAACVVLLLALVLWDNRGDKKHWADVEKRREERELSEETGRIRYIKDAKGKN